MRALVIAAVLATISPPTASAFTCPQWNRMSPQQKTGEVDRMIASAISGSRGRSMRVDRGQVERCIYGAATSLQYDIDGVCSDSRKASTRSIDRVFKTYIWSCVG